MGKRNRQGLLTEEGIMHTSRQTLSFCDSLPQNESEEKRGERLGEEKGEKTQRELREKKIDKRRKRDAKRGRESSGERESEGE